MERSRTPGHRVIEAELRLLGPDHRPLASRLVRVAQERHAFLFGCIGFELIPLANGESEAADVEVAERLARHWFELFNAVTLPFYWGWFEPVRGAPDTARLRTAARWFAERGAVVKGHPLCWHTETAPWLLDLSTDEIGQAQLARIRREGGQFADLIDTWDASSSATRASDCRSTGRRARSCQAS